MMQRFGGSDQRKRADLLFGSIFVLASVLTLVESLRAGIFFFEAAIDSRFWLVGAIGCLFFLGMRFHRLRLAEPYLFLLLAAIPFFQSPEAVFGFGLFAVGAIMLYVDGHMRRRPLTKMALLVAYLFSLVSVAGVVTHWNLEQVLKMLLFMAGFFLYLFLTFLEKIIVFVKAEKPLVALTEKGLTEKETEHLLSLLAGQTIKEIAWGHGVKDSTVRNSLSRAYHKLGFTDKTQVLQWAENHTVQR